MAPKSIDRFLLIAAALLSILVVVVNASKDDSQVSLDKLMELCDPEKHSEQLNEEQIELVYDKFLASLKDEQELYDLVKESSDLFESNMKTDSNELKEKYIDNHTLRVCVMYSMIKGALDSQNEIVE